MYNILFNYGYKQNIKNKILTSNKKKLICVHLIEALRKEAELITASKRLSFYHELVQENGSSTVFPGRISSSNQNKLS
jgi:hypothetical protein